MDALMVLQTSRESEIDVHRAWVFLRILDEDKLVARYLMSHVIMSVAAYGSGLNWSRRS